MKDRMFGRIRALPRPPFVVVVPMLVILVLVTMAIFPHQLAPYSPTEMELRARLIPPAWSEGGTMAHLLGTDRFGRDQLSRIIFGSRLALTVSLLVIFVGASLGTVIGLISGYVGGVVDAVLMQLVDIFLSIPLILVAILLAVLLGPSAKNVILVVGLLLWPRYARQVRGETLSIKEQNFVALARVAGASPWRIMGLHILPNIVPTLLVLSTLQVGFVIILESALSFFGVGVPPPQPAWGLMVSEGRGLIATAWWLSLFPGLVILVTVLAFNLVGDWLRDYLDPRLRRL